MRRLLLSAPLILGLGVIAPHTGLSETISEGMNSQTFGLFSQGTSGGGAWSGEIESQGMMMSNGVIYSQGSVIPDGSSDGSSGGSSNGSSGGSSGLFYGNGGAGATSGGPSPYGGFDMGSTDPSLSTDPFSPTLPGFAGILDGGGDEWPGGVVSFNTTSFDFHDPDKHDEKHHDNHYGNHDDHDPPPRSVPEPMTLALLGTALLGFRVIRRGA